MGLVLLCAISGLAQVAAADAPLVPATCDKLAAPLGSDGAAGTLANPYATPLKLINSLAPGQRGCFRAGTYNFSQLDLMTPNVTLAPYGDEAVTLRGAIKVRPAGHHSTFENMKLHGGSAIGPKIYADGVVLRENEITNEHTSTCVHVGSWYEDPAPVGVVIERNRIHDCGELPTTNKEHGIYLSEARDAIVRDNWIYDNVDRGVQQYFEVHGARITGNVIVRNGQGVNFSGGSDQIVEGNIIAHSNLRWNVYAGSTGGPGDGVLRDNCVFADKPGFTTNGGIQSSNVFSEAGNLIAKPGFANLAAKDFHLELGDACLAKYTGTMSLPAGPPPPPLPQHTLTVQVQGSGTGAVTGPGISCPGDCTETYTEGQQLTLSAGPGAGSSFAGWGDACSGPGACQLTMDADKLTSASFDQLPPPPPPPAGPYTLRPNVDLASAWRVFGASSAWAALDDNLLQPTAPGAGDYIQPSANGQVTTLGFATQALTGVPQAAAVWYYARTTSGTKLQLDVRWGGVTRATYTLAANKGYSWRYLLVVPPNQAAVDDLSLRLTASGGTNVIVRAAYVRLYV